MRREAAERAMARDEESRFQKVLERAGIVLLPGSAAYKEVLNTLKMYSEATGQSFQQVLSDPVQMGAIIGDPEDLAGYLKLPVDESNREAVIARKELKERVRAAQAANQRIDAAVHYSQAIQSPRLAAYADEVRQPLGVPQADTTGFHRESAPGSSQAVNAWKKNVDPEFLDKLSFVHWTADPIPLAASPRGVVDGALSASAYLRDDPSGMGTLFQRILGGGLEVGFILEGEPSFIANMDINSYTGSPQSMTTALMDPVLDEDTFMTDARRAEFRRQHSFEGSEEILEEMGASGELYQWRPYAGQPGHNEALIQKPRIVGIVVDPYQHSRNDFDTIVTARPNLEEAPRFRQLQKMPERTAVILAEEMNLPLFDPAGKVLLQPEGVSDEQVRQVSRNIPSGENIPRRVTDEELPYLIDRAHDSMEANELRARTRNNILEGLTEEIKLHTDPNFRIDTDEPMGIHQAFGRYVDSPRISREELDVEIERVRQRPDFDDPYAPGSYNEQLERRNFHPSLAPVPEATKIEELKEQILIAKYNLKHGGGDEEYQQRVRRQLEEAQAELAEVRRSRKASAPARTPAPMGEEYIESMQEQERIQRIQKEIQDAEQQLAAADPGTPEARQVASKLARAKAALARLGYLAGVAGTAYEGGRLAGEIGRHGLLEGTQRYGGTVAKETGELLEVPQMLAQTLPGYGERGVHPGAELLAAGGRALQRGGRALRGEREETRGVGLDPSVQGLDDMPEMQEFDRELQEILAQPTTAPARLRENAARRALMSSRERDEENL